VQYLILSELYLLPAEIYLILTELYLIRRSCPELEIDESAPAAWVRFLELDRLVLHLVGCS
jgi:hypothetical protein